MKYKVGDRVKIKSLDWYNKNKNNIGGINISRVMFIPEMTEYCGRVVTISRVNEYYYDIIDDDDHWCWTDDMIEGLVEEEALKQYEVPTGSIKIWDLPEGYQFKDQEGNVINTTKIVLEKKKKEYPKTYEECCKVIGFCSDTLKWNNPFHINRDTHPYIKHLDNLMESFYKILICRDAYWKIAGEEMGLGKPWEPDWKNSEERRYCIVNIEGDINLPETTLTKWILKVTNKILVFPTIEMRDAFYENFKDLIEQCKELL